MAVIQKTYQSSVESVVVTKEGIRVMVAIRDTSDPGNVAARMMVAVKDGKVVQPATKHDEVDPKVVEACALILGSFETLCDKIVTEKPVIIHGSVPPSRPTPGQPAG